MLGNRILQRLQHDPCLHTCRAVDGIDFLDADHALRRQDEIRTPGVCAMDQTREPPMRHHALAALVAQREDRRHLLGFARTYDGAGADRIAAPDACRARSHVFANKYATRPE